MTIHCLFEERWFICFYKAQHWKVASFKKNAKNVQSKYQYVTLILCCLYKTNNIMSWLLRYQTKSSTSNVKQFWCQIMSITQLLLHVTHTKHTKAKV